MENVLLIVHLIIALALISVVLLQRSEGGALGIGGGGGGGGGLMSSRGATTALTKLTWGLAIAFLATSISLTILAGGRDTGSVFDRQVIEQPQVQIEDLLPGAADEPSGEAPVVPQPAQ